MEDLRGFCSLFYASHYLPIALYNDSGLACAVGFPETGDPYPFVREKLTGRGNPAVYVSSDTGSYGLVRCDSTHFFVLGPVYSTPVTEEIVSIYQNKNAIPPRQWGETAQFLCGIPNYTYNQFLNLLLYLLYVLTGERKTVSDAFHITDMSQQEQIGRQHTLRSYTDREDHRQHGSYHFERQMLEVIRSGDMARLERFLMSALQDVPLQEGKLADTPLRQAKNLFIGTVSMVGKEAAIPAGLDIEQAYQLIDTYIQECERMQSVDTIKNLQYNMLMDFTQRISRQRLPADLSPEVLTAMQFISAHINQPIGVDDVVAHAGTSRARLFQCFRRELGVGISAYITQCRLREAKSLLRYTDKPLGEISSYLCFSSQSYFQNVFKKYVGVTPLGYRQRGAEAISGDDAADG